MYSTYLWIQNTTNKQHWWDTGASFSFFLFFILRWLANTKQSFCEFWLNSKIELFFFYFHSDFHWMFSVNSHQSEFQPNFYIMTFHFSRCSALTTGCVLGWLNPILTQTKEKKSVFSIHQRKPATRLPVSSYSASHKANKDNVGTVMIKVSGFASSSSKWTLSNVQHWSINIHMKMILSAIDLDVEY